MLLKNCISQNPLYNISFKNELKKTELIKQTSNIALKRILSSLKNILKRSNILHYKYNKIAYTVEKTNVS